MCIFCDRYRNEDPSEWALVDGDVIDAEGCASLRKRRKKCTVVTGFLGAGKTTFLNHILSSTSHNRKIGVIVNEFGETTIDDKLLKNPKNRVERCDESGMSVVSLENGCVCCTVRDDLVKAILRFATGGRGATTSANGTATGGGTGVEGGEDATDDISTLSPSTTPTEVSSAPTPGTGGGGSSSFLDEVDYLIVECSGLSEVVPVCQTFYERDVQAAFQLDGVVCVLDCKKYWQEFGPEIDPGGPHLMPPSRPEKTLSFGNHIHDQKTAETPLDIRNHDLTTTESETQRELDMINTTTRGFVPRPETDLRVEDIPTEEDLLCEMETDLVPQTEEVDEEEALKAEAAQRRALMVEQLTLSDIVLANKIDLVPKAVREKILTHLREQNHLLETIPCRNGRVSVKQVIDRDLFTPTSSFLKQQPKHIFQESRPNSFFDLFPPPTTAGSSERTTIAADNNSSSSTFSSPKKKKFDLLAPLRYSKSVHSISLEMSNDPLDTVKLRSFLADLYMRHAKARVLRCKGILQVQDSELGKPYTVVVQGVADHVDWEQTAKSTSPSSTSSPSSSDHKMKSKFVIIFQNPDHVNLTKIKDEFERCTMCRGGLQH
ncbi:unnamed protein product [Amoebophrya sp. A25]|nr:unnamed protein product [Amoebophrya sp. A25]|eukprot:GSA25T00004989001.1